MKIANSLNFNCRHCRHFDPEGRRGGTCQKLGVPVHSNWEACTLACPPFSPSWKTLEDIAHLETSLTFNYTSESKTNSIPNRELSCSKLNSL
ncbi:MAG: hypothetical protein QNJ18_02730 [Xenococcaceae cyanobacterium MO_167.B52]|nr:hypothetical protein [Xenococcaceae cyanobacterium MO_167.B52]